MELDEFAQVGETISEYASEDATVVIGTVLDPAMEGNLRVTMVATGIRNPTSGVPEVRVIEGGRAAEPEDINYDQPTVIRRRPRQATAVAVESNAAENLDYLDVPAFSDGVKLINWKGLSQGIGHRVELGSRTILSN